MRPLLSLDDRAQINEIIALHAHIFDEHQLERLDELFTADAVYDMTPTGIGAFEGIETIRVAAARMIGSGQFPLMHVVTNVVIASTDEDTATAWSKGLMIMGDGAIQGVSHHDTLRRYNGGWRISRRVITPARSVAAGGH